MIVNIRGTGGAGKSTIVRMLKAKCSTCLPEYQEGRARPIGYRCGRHGQPPLYIVGHYETPAGGADTIKTPDEVYAIIRTQATAGADVVFEGIITQDDVNRCAALAREFPLKVVALDVPLEVCLASINARRQERQDRRAAVLSDHLFGPPSVPADPVNPKNTTDRAKRLIGTMRRLTAAGVETYWASRDEALRLCMEWLQL